MNMQIDMIEESAAPAVVPPAERAALALGTSKTEKDLLTLATKHVGITEIKDKAGREQAHGAAMELMRARTQIKKVADEAREDAKKFNQAVLAEEKRLTAIVEPEEKRLKDLRDAWDAEQDRIKLEAQRIERERLLKITERIAEIKGYATLATQCRTAERVKALIDKVAAYELTGFDEFDAEAAKAHADTMSAMGEQFRVLTEREAEAARIKAEREELALQQAEARRQAVELAAKQQEEADRLARERAELERLRAEIEAAARTVPPVVAPEKQPLADLVQALAETGIALVNDLQASHAARTDAGQMTCCEAGPAGGVCNECADTSAAYSQDMRRTDDDSDIVAAEIRLGFDMAMSAPIVTAQKPADDTPPAASLIKCIAFEYGVDLETACHWLCVRADDFLEWTDTKSTAA
jgi:hypothetical protein